MGFLDRIFSSRQTTAPTTLAQGHEHHQHFGCVACGGKFHSRVELEAHGKAQHAPAATQLKCGACGGNFATKAALEAHARENHAM